MQLFIGNMSYSPKAKLTKLDQLQPVYNLAHVGWILVTLVHLGDRMNARYAFEEAVASSSDCAAAALNYALFLLEEGDKPGANTMFLKFQTEAERVPRLEIEV